MRQLLAISQKSGSDMLRYLRQAEAGLAETGAIPELPESTKNRHHTTSAGSPESPPPGADIATLAPVGANQREGVANRGDSRAHAQNARGTSQLCAIAATASRQVNQSRPITFVMDPFESTMRIGSAHIELICPDAKGLSTQPALRSAKEALYAWINDTLEEMATPESRATTLREDANDFDIISNSGRFE